MEQPQNIYEIHFSWSVKNMTDTLEQVCNPWSYHM